MFNGVSTLDIAHDQWMQCKVRVYLPGVSHETTITVIKRAHGARDIPFLRVLRQRDEVQPTKIGPARPGRRECSGADPWCRRH